MRICGGILQRHPAGGLSDLQGTTTKPARRRRYGKSALRAEALSLIRLISGQSYFRGLGQGLPLASGTKGVQAPNILRFVMAQDKVVPVLRANAKIDRARRIPLILNFHDFEGAPAQSKTYGALVGSISGIALDAHFAHRCLPLPKVYISM